MSEFPHLREVYNSCENQYNPYDFTPNSCGYFNDNYSLNDLNFEPQNFQNDEPLTLESNISSLLELSTKQNQSINDLCNSYLCNSSSQHNQNLNSLQNSNDFECNQCQFNFEFQDEFQNRDENVNQFSNNFGNRNCFNNDTIENFGYQQIQNENVHINNHEFDFVDQMEKITGIYYLKNTKKFVKTIIKSQLAKNQIIIYRLSKLKILVLNKSKSKIFKLIITSLTLLSK